jgi:hypothetical protein
MTQTIDLKIYRQLVAEVTPKVIETEEEEYDLLWYQWIQYHQCNGGG